MSESLEARVARLEMAVAKLEDAAAVRSARSGRSDGPIATVGAREDLSGPFDDPELKFPLFKNYWPEEGFGVGRRFSEFEPEFLDAIAKAFEDSVVYFQRKGDERKATFKREDAKRARLWAAKKRSEIASPVAEDGLF